MWGSLIQALLGSGAMSGAMGGASSGLGGVLGGTGATQAGPMMASGGGGGGLMEALGIFGGGGMPGMPGMGGGKEEKPPLPPIPVVDLRRPAPPMAPTSYAYAPPQTRMGSEEDYLSRYPVGLQFGIGR